ncbi:hypothetical protein FB451DRAFT_1549628 [Mycena latifolia]|nr:hypothetical protein FB451DRAFT_1549628 [Mycena latifolia]
MDTPMLWSTIVVDTICWNNSPLSSDTLLGLVASSLERGVEVPLTLEIAVWPGDSIEQPLLELISQHARRWKRLWIHPKSIRFLASARGNLLLLERLELHSNTREVLAHESGLGDDIFDIVPRLTHLKLTRWPSRLAPLPWGQLLDVSFTPRNLDQLSFGFDILSLISNARCTLEVDVPSTIFPFILQSVTTNISTLVLEFNIFGPFQMHAQTLFAKILERLTLPRLSELRIGRKSAGSPSPWPQQHFLAFASRSSLHASLTSLEIQAVIQEDELLQCLEHLPSLETLAICDCEAAEGNHVLITDNLLHRLVWRPDNPSLQVVPRLSSLCLISLMQFCDDSLCEFLSLRLPPGRWDKCPFDVQILWLPGRERELPTDFIDRFPPSEDSEQRTIVLRLAPYSY